MSQKHLESPRSKSHHQPNFPNTTKRRLILLIITTIPLVVGFVLNITSNQAVFNLNQNIVPKLQNGYTMSSFLTILMNVVSNVFNPVLCAGYIILFFLISYRKLEILVFLIWFIFLSFVLSMLKSLIQQARPYWIAASGVQMLEWTCYTEYGCPSGHAMMGIILMEFIVRFFARSSRFVAKYIVLFYFLIIFLELIVMFSRIFLGMHAINQVMFGFMIGVYSFIPYYLFVERWILHVCLQLANTKNNLINISIIFAGVLLSICVEFIVTFVPEFNLNDAYFAHISTFSRCDHVKIAKSFQYRCFQDSAIINGSFAILLAFLVNKNKMKNLYKMLIYSRLSGKFVLKLIVVLVVSLIPVGIFLNPFWSNFELPNPQLATLLWACNFLGFFVGIGALLIIAPAICGKLNFEMYATPETYQQFKKYQVLHFYEQVNEIAMKQKNLDIDENLIQRHNSIEV